MELTLCREIVVETHCVGTTDIMDYADAHPNEYFDFTEVHSRHTDYGRLMVSEYNPQFMSEKDWHDLYNGWQRKSNCDGVWVCRKNGRYIIITC
jgi:hypothetical protein